MSQSDGTENKKKILELFDDAKNKELVWQGVGEGYLSTRIDKKEERIKKFTSSILTKYPPQNVVCLYCIFTM